MSELSDKELFESAIADNPIEAPEAPEVAVEEAPEAGQARDEKGRFAAKEATAEPEPVQPEQPKPDTEAHVPSWRLREVNEAREAAERRAQEAADRATHLERQFAALQQQMQQAQQKPQEPVDWFSNPDQALQQQLTPLEQRLAQAEQRAILRASRAEQIAIHGRQAVDEMEKAVEQAMRSGHPELASLSAQMRGSDDPVGLAMQWYQRDKLVKETGGDLSAFKSKILEDAMKDPAFQARVIEAAKAQAGGQVPGVKPNAVVQLPPSLNRATSSASPHDEAGDLTDRSLYAFATR